MSCNGLCDIWLSHLASKRLKLPLNGIVCLVMLFIARTPCCVYVALSVIRMGSVLRYSVCGMLLWFRFIRDFVQFLMDWKLIKTFVCRCHIFVVHCC